MKESNYNIKKTMKWFTIGILFISSLLYTSLIFGQISNNSFVLSSNLQIEIDPQSDESIGLYLFKKNKFCVTVDLTGLNARKQKARVIFNIKRLSDSVLVYRIEESIRIDTTGRNGDVLNQSEYDTYQTTKTTLKDSIKAMRLEIKDPATTTQRKQELRQLIQDTRQTLDALQPVELIYEKIDKYSQVIGVMFDNGILTPAGIAWAKQLPFLDSTLIDYIE